MASFEWYCCVTQFPLSIRGKEDRIERDMMSMREVVEVLISEEEFCLILLKGKRVDFQFSLFEFIITNLM